MNRVYILHVLQKQKELKCYLLMKQTTLNMDLLELFIAGDSTEEGWKVKTTARFVVMQIIISRF
jgi:hypothetical protein